MRDGKWWGAGFTFDAAKVKASGHAMWAEPVWDFGIGVSVFIIDSYFADAMVFGTGVVTAILSYGAAWYIRSSCDKSVKLL